MTDGGMVPITLKALRQAGWKATRIQAGTARGGRQHLADAGWPDIIALQPWECGRTYLIECKSEKGNLRKSQEEFRKWCSTMNHNYVVIRTVEDIEELLR